MDAGDDGAGSSLSLELDELIPPRLEDAGLEDCALPLESIQLAFLKAADAAAAAAAADASDAPEGDDVVAGALSEPDEPADDVAGPCSRGDGGGKAEASSTDEAEDSAVGEMQKLEIGKVGKDLKS